MTAFKAYFHKEITESIRQYRYIILAAGFIIFAILDPIMLKILPSILASQVPEELMQLMHTDQQMAFQNYIKDLSQITSLFIALSLMGMIGEEAATGKLVLPYSKGARIQPLVTAKIVHYIAAIWFFTPLGLFINYYYITTLFKDRPVDITAVYKSILLMGVYFSFMVTLVAFFSALTKKGIVAGISALIVVYITPLLADIKAIKAFIPYTLVKYTNLATPEMDSQTWVAVVAVAAEALIVAIAAVYAAQRRWREIPTGSTQQ